MDNEELKEEVKEVADEQIPPLEVKIVNEKKKESTPYDDKEDTEYDDLRITEEQKKEFEDGNT